MSRSLYELVHLHLAASFKMHLFGPVVYLLALLLFIKLSVEMISGSTLQIRINSGLIKKASIIFVSLWVGYWLVRMAFEWVL